MMYWTNQHGIHRAFLDGSQPETLIVGEENLRAFALAPHRDKMYWRHGGEIWWANLDGSQPALFHPHDPLFPRADPKTLAIDHAGDALYWMDQTNRMHRITLDGTAHEVLFTKPHRAFWGEALAVDTRDGKVYWINRSVYRANLDDGSHVELLVPNAGYSFGLALDLDGGKMYWTVFEGTHGSEKGLYRANLDGSQVEALVTGVELGGLALAPGRRGE